MNKRYLRWLYGELPELVSRAVISAEAAGKIRDHYGETESGSGRRMALTVCSVLGALLIGAGVILLLAHNWEDLGRPIRTILALAPLGVCQALAGWVLWKDKRSAAWREGVGLGLTLSIAAAIALVGQTYHVPGDLGHFLMAWMLLTLPVVYLLDSAVPSLIYFAGIPGWAGHQQSGGGFAILFWPLLALAVPYLYLEARKNPYSHRSVILGWGLSLCLCVGTGIALDKAMPGLWTIVYASLFPILYLIGWYGFREAPSASQRPFHTVGALGATILAFLFTFEFPWDHVGWNHYHSDSLYHRYAAWLDYGLAILLPAIAIGLLVMAFRRRDRSHLLFGILPVITVAAYSLAAWGDAEFPAMLLFNIYVFVLGLRTVIVGIRKSRIGTVNAGMVIQGALNVARFFDVDLGFVTRGIAFILLGIGFLATNLVLMKRAKGGAQ